VGSYTFSGLAVFQLERSEWKNTITLARLKGVALAMSCELVYAIAPWEENFEGQAIGQANLAGIPYS
jgi:hypothetical protein